MDRQIAWINWPGFSIICYCDMNIFIAYQAWHTHSFTVYESTRVTLCQPRIVRSSEINESISFFKLQSIQKVSTTVHW